MGALGAARAGFPLAASAQEIIEEQARALIQLVA